MWLFLLILVYTLTCVFVILTILLQSGKGGGLSSLGSGAGGALSDSLGATGAEKTLVKATSWGSGIFLALSIILTLYGSYVERSAGLSIGAAPATTAPATTAPASTAPATTVPATTAPAATAPATTAPAAGQPAAGSTAPAGTSQPDAPAAPPPAAPEPAGQPAQPEAS